MKGYAQVEIKLASQARDNFRTWIKETETKIDELIDLYYQKFYKGGNWFVRYWYRKDSPEQFFRSQLDIFETFDEELWKVTDDEKLLDDIRMWNYGKWSEQSRAIRHLMSASSTEYILCDNELCAFVEKWK